MNEDDAFGYWNYYSNHFDWDKTSSFRRVNKQYSIKKFKDNGLSELEAIQLWESGYVYIEGYDIVIDRYYGGLLSSYDTTTRLLPSQVKSLFSTGRSKVWVQSASSLEEVYKIIDVAKSKSSKSLHFRGQRQNYFVDRKINNPNFTIDGLGEISILSSFWRKVFAKARNSFIDFQSLTHLEWSNIFFTAYDLKEIERRHRLALDNGEWLHSMQDMADSDDQFLSDFGNHRLGLAMGLNSNLSDILSTLLQHYGLLSTVIDLTTSIDVALFFATHKYTSNGGVSSYEFVGTNTKQSVLYLIRANDNEMVHHAHDRILDRIPPERPLRQHCVISRSSTFSVNLPAFFLEGIINLEFDLEEADSPKKMIELFPGEDEDKFLKALRQGLSQPDKVSFFG